MLTTFLALVVNNIIIYQHVRKTLLPSKPSRNSKDIESLDFSVDEASSCRDNESGALSMASRTTNSSQKSTKRRLAREAAIQGFLYVFCFWLTQTSTVVLSVLDGSMGYDIKDKSRLYPLLVVQSLLAPLQGFFNVFIYVRPSYSRFAGAHPDIAG